MSDVKNKPFFYATDVYPDLYVDKILFEYDYYSYYILIDKKHNYFVSHCYEVEEQQSWIINKIDINTLVDFLCNKIDIRNIFLCNNEKKVIITRSYTDGKESYKEFLNDEIKKMDILPDENVFIDVDEDEYKDYINKLKEHSLKEKIVYSEKEHFKLSFTEYDIKELCSSNLYFVTDIKYSMLDKKENRQLIFRLSSTEYTTTSLTYLFYVIDKKYDRPDEEYSLINKFLNLYTNKTNTYIDNLDIIKYFSNIFSNNYYEYNSLRNSNPISKSILTKRCIKENC